MKKEHKIYGVKINSIGEELEIEEGDVLLSINGKEIEDIFDYYNYMSEEYLEVLIRKANGEEWELEIEKEGDEEIGITFENGLMDTYKSCHNKCIFCFIDQMPKGMRETLYFKDDDSRLSFLQGNYVTLTNMKDQDIKRIIEYKLGPINISIHTTNKELRCEMLHNRFAGKALDKIQMFFDAQIPMNGQIVLCKGINDQEELENTIKELIQYLPYLESVSVVPAGLTKYRDGLAPLEPFTKEDAKQVLNTIRKWQQICLEQQETHFIHGSDEWYLLAEQDLPEEVTYDGYLQLENGVGMLRLLQNEFEEALEEEKDTREANNTIETECDIACSIATGTLAYPFMKQFVAQFMNVYKGSNIHVYEIKNHFFGEQITVSGLITGTDLMEQLKGKNLGEKLLLPCNMLRSGEMVFLDDVTVQAVEKALQVPVDIVKSSGQQLLEALKNE